MARHVALRPRPGRGCASAAPGAGECCCTARRRPGSAVAARPRCGAGAGRRSQRWVAVDPFVLALGLGVSGLPVMARVPSAGRGDQLSGPTTAVRVECRPVVGQQQLGAPGRPRCLVDDRDGALRRSPRRSRGRRPAARACRRGPGTRRPSCRRPTCHSNASSSPALVDRRELETAVGGAGSLLRLRARPSHGGRRPVRVSRPPARVNPSSPMWWRTVTGPWSRRRLRFLRIRTASSSTSIAIAWECRAPCCPRLRLHRAERRSPGPGPDLVEPRTGHLVLPAESAHRPRARTLRPRDDHRAHVHRNHPVCHDPLSGHHRSKCPDEPET